MPKKVEKNKTASSKNKQTPKDKVEKVKTVVNKTVEKSSTAKKTPTKAKSAKKNKEEIVSKLRIRVRAYEYKILDLSVKQIIDTAIRYEAKVIGPIPLPTEIKKYTVNRSPFIYKNSREQFEMRVHKRLIDIIDPSPKIMEALTNLSLPSGVNIEVKIT